MHSDLLPIWETARNQISRSWPVLLAASLLIAWCALSLTELLDKASEHSRQSRSIAHLFAYLTAAPLLIAPSVVSKALTSNSFWFSLIHPKSLQIATLGFAFHLFLSTILFSLVFNWPQRRWRFRVYRLNLRSISPLGYYGLFVRDLLSPFIIVVAIDYNWLQAMYSTPLMVSSGRTIGLYLIQQLQQLLSNTDRLIVSFAYFMFLAITIGGAAITSRLIGQLLLGIATRRKRIRSASLNCSRSRPFKTSGGKLCLFTFFAIFGAAIPIAVAVSAITTICAPRKNIPLRDSLSMLQTLWTPGTMASLVSLILIPLLVYFFHKGKRSTESVPVWIYASILVALSPPAIVGAVALTAAYPATQWIIALVALFLMAASTTSFLGQNIIVNDIHSTVLNARLLRCSFWRQVRIFAASDIARLYLIGLVSCYLLWIEDGVQQMLGISTPYPSLSQKLISVMGDFTSRQWKGVFVCFLFWIILLTSVYICWRARERILRIAPSKALGASRTGGLAALGIFLYLVCTPRMQATQGPRWDNGKLMHTVIRGGGAIIIDVPDLPNQGTALINELYIEAASSVTFLLPPGLHGLKITGLHLDTGQRLTIRFLGGDPNTVQLLADLTIQFSSAPSKSINGVSLRFDRLAVGNLRVEGSNSIPIGQATQGPSTDLMFQSGGVFGTVVIANIALDDAAIPLTEWPLARSTKGYEQQQPKGVSRVVIENVAFRKISLYGLKSTDTDATQISVNSLYLSAFPVAEPWNTPEIRLSDISLGSGTLNIADPRDSPILPKNILTVISLNDFSLDSTSLGLGEASSPDLAIDTAASIEPEIRIVQGAFGGILNFKSRGPISSVLLQDISTVSRGPEFGVVGIKSMSSIDSVTLYKVQLDQLELAAEKRAENSRFEIIGGPLPIYRIIVSPSILKMIYLAALDDPQARTFLGNLRHDGYYSSKGPSFPLIGRDALYLQKKAEMGSENWLVQKLVDHVTGFGVKLERPFWLWIAYSSLFIVIFMNYGFVLKRNDKKLRVLGKIRFLLSILIFDDLFHAQSTHCRKLRMLRNTYWSVVALHMTILTLFLAQTAL